MPEETCFSTLEKLKSILTVEQYEGMRAKCVRNTMNQQRTSPGVKFPDIAGPEFKTPEMPDVPDIPDIPLGTAALGAAAIGGGAVIGTAAIVAVAGALIGLGVIQSQNEPSTVNTIIGRDNSGNITSQQTTVT